MSRPITKHIGLPPGVHPRRRAYYLVLRRAAEPANMEGK